MKLLNSAVLALLLSPTCANLRADRKLKAKKEKAPKADSTPKAPKADKTPKAAPCPKGYSEMHQGMD